MLSRDDIPLLRNEKNDCNFVKKYSHFFGAGNR